MPQVRGAEKRGAGGVLLFLEPGVVSPEGQDAHHTYPYTVFAPPHAAQLGTTMMGNGDPLTPFYPSIGKDIPSYSRPMMNTGLATG